MLTAWSILSSAICFQTAISGEFGSLLTLEDVELLMTNFKSVKDFIVMQNIGDA